MNGRFRASQQAWFRASRRCHFTAMGLGVCLMLVGCSSPGQDSLQDWITAQRAQVRLDTTPIAPLKTFTPQPYQEGSGPDPFSSQRLTQALRAVQDATSALVRPEQNRPRQALEAYPLDAMSLVGSLVRDGRPVALVRIDQIVHTVRVGAYLGQNYGRVVRITENQLVLREIVQDASGQWTERLATLQLREGSP
ncbi:MAG: hypothetical protein RL522_303 [Pseudomonadota bacterium]|jgi:type IV pilus assembly protein PilP